MAFEVRFKDESLEKLEKDAQLDTGYQPGIGKTFRKRMQLIRSAADERDFYALKSLHYEKLKGKKEAPTLDDVKRPMATNSRSRGRKSQKDRFDRCN